MQAFGSFSETHIQSMGLIMPGALSREVLRLRSIRSTTVFYVNDSCNIKQEQT